MYEDMTYESILATAQGNVKDDILKGEGSLVYNALSVLAMEEERIYMQMDYLLKQRDPEQADFENLKVVAAARAVYPAEATQAVVRVRANTELPEGSRFSLSAYHYEIIGALSDGYAARCEEAGSGANELRGELTAITYVDGLEKAEIVELLSAGQEADGRDELYEKYMDSFQSQAFAGNITAYKQQIGSFDGVGGVKVYPTWNGPGTVKCVVLGADKHTISEYLQEQIQKAADPVPGKGYGFAPVDHIVTIEPAEVEKINIELKIEFDDGYSYSQSEETIKAAVERLLEGLRTSWAEGGENDYLRVYVSRVESAILDVEGVLDVQETKLNGSRQNITLQSNQIPELGEVKVV